MKRLTLLDWFLLALVALFLMSFGGCATVERHKDALIAAGASVAIYSVALSMGSGGPPHRLRLPYEPPAPKVLP